MSFIVSEIGKIAMVVRDPKYAQRTTVLRGGLRKKVGSRNESDGLTLEFVTWSAGTDSGTVCRVLRMLADIVGQPVSLQPQTLVVHLQRCVDAPSSPLTPGTKEEQQRWARGMK